MRKSWVALLGILAVELLLLKSPAQALNVQLLRPGTGQTQGYQLFTSDKLPKYHLVLGTNINYAYRPLQQVFLGTTERVAGIVDHFVTQDFLVSFGFTDWLSINIDMPLNLYHDIAPTFIPTRDKGGLDAGDLGVNFKITFWDADETGSHLGLALVPFITFPTGDETIFFGDSSLTGGATLVGDAQWKSNRFFLNVGTRFREEEVVSNLTVNEELLYGLGFQRPLVKDWDFNIIAELYGSTNYRKFATENISTPLEGLLTFQKKWLENRRLVTNLGGGAGITSGYGIPVFRIFLGVSYAWDLTQRKPKEIIDLKGKINFEFDKAIIKRESYPIIDDVAETLMKHPEMTLVQIEGHTDAKGSDAYNQKLSERRANALKDYLVKKGIEPDRLTTVGFGESQPIAPNTNPDGSDNPAGRDQNRRSVFRVLKRTDK